MESAFSAATRGHPTPYFSVYLGYFFAFLFCLFSWMLAEQAGCRREKGLALQGFLVYTLIGDFAAGD
jgi:hypothetical protein